MKKTLLAVGALSVLLLGGALLAHAAGAKSEAAKASPAASAAKSDAALQEKLEATERKAWDAFKSQDFNAFKAVVAENCVSADMNGFATLDQMEPMMKDYAVQSYTLDNVKLIRVGRDAAVLTYTANTTATYKGNATPAGPYYVSSVYANRGGKWVGVYHQETLAASAMPSPTPAASTNK